MHISLVFKVVLKDNRPFNAKIITMYYGVCKNIEAKCHDNDIKARKSYVEVTVLRGFCLFVCFGERGKEE